MQDLADKSTISLVRINNEKELRRYNLDELSNKLWQRDCPRQFPAYIVFYESKPCGFFLALQQTVIYPAIHPEEMSKRSFVKVVRSLVTEMKRMVGNPLFLLCNKADQFNERQMKLFRLKRAEENAYVYTEED